MASALSSCTAFSGRTFAPASVRPARAARASCVRPVAAVVGQPPKGVTQPPREPEAVKATNGFVENAEIINSRAAMIGFFGLLALEGFSGHSLLDIMGVASGNGLNLGL